MEDQGGKSYFLSPNNLSNTGRSCCQKNWFPLAERCKPSLKNDCQLSFATMAAHKSRYSIFSILAMCTTRRAYSFVLSFCLSPDLEVGGGEIRIICGFVEKTSDLKKFKIFVKFSSNSSKGTC
eukprot:TRINITY_DN3922_c0_g1_i1.p2 TRINITY_DN3922_c0_g1~~TRINITY_DN3922_c0_g1_i1.p2  ORF type:complete len:123 (-),score=12.98 TRINITY_DN3922_c0_g1_i1:426-794(-)